MRIIMHGVDQMTTREIERMLSRKMKLVDVLTHPKVYAVLNAHAAVGGFPIEPRASIKRNWKIKNSAARLVD